MADPTAEDWYATIGRATHHAALIDLIVMNALRVACSYDFHDLHAIYYAPDAFSTRAKIVRNLLKIRNAHPVITGIVNAIIEQAEIANGRRNELAHSSLLVTEKGHVRLNMRNILHSAQPVTWAYIHTAMGQIETAYVSAQSKFSELCDLLKVQHDIFH